MSIVIFSSTLESFRGNIKPYSSELNFLNVLSPWQLKNTVVDDSLVIKLELYGSSVAVVSLFR